MSVCLSFFLRGEGGGGNSLCKIFFSQTQDLSGRKHLFDFSDGSPCMFFFAVQECFQKLLRLSRTNVYFTCNCSIEQENCTSFPNFFPGSCIKNEHKRLSTNNFSPQHQVRGILLNPELHVPLREVDNKLGRMHEAKI